MRNRRVGRRSGCSCWDDRHRACGLEKKKQGEKEGRSSGSDDCLEALHDGDAQRWLRGCDGLEHSW
eukprot:2056359-Pleurochrysis_carterae.AAC.1